MLTVFMMLTLARYFYNKFSLTKMEKFSYDEAISFIHPGTYNISEPKVKGFFNVVLIADTPNGKHVCKFNDKIAQRSAEIKKVLTEYEIPSPLVTVAKYKNYFVETYPYSCGPTLFERIGQGMSEEKVKQVYKDVLDYTKTMSGIAPEKFKHIKYKKAHQISRETFLLKGDVCMAFALEAVQRFLNIGKKGFYHTDASPKNIVLDQDDNFDKFLDMDSFSLCHESFALGAIILANKRIGYDTDYIYDYYQNIYNSVPNKTRINMYCGLLSAGRKAIRKISGGGPKKR